MGPESVQRRPVPPGWLLAACLFAWACSSSSPGVSLEQAAGAASGYNVLLVTLDTTRADRLGCYGHADATTPTLDALAAGGVQVSDAVTVAPVTLPAHASILTGRYPPEHGVRDNGEFRLDAEVVTLAEMLQSAGYATGAFVSAFVLDARYGLDQGFDHYDDNVQNLARVGGMVDHANERDAKATTRAALAWLGERESDAPFFAWVHYFDPHQPYSPPSGPPLPGDLYDAEIAFVDRQLARLLESIESSGQAANTLTIIVADHGEGLGEHDEETHTMLIYGSTMRVPLIFHAPGALAPGQRLDGGVVSVVDIVPTLVSMLGLDPPAETDGVALTAGAPDSDRLVYMESLVPWLDHGWSPLFGIRRHHDKAILAPAREYYALDSDPGESDNRWSDPSGSTAARRDRLESELAAWLADWPTLDAVAEAAQVMDSEERARLESLGYVSGGRSGLDATLKDPKTMMPLVARLDRAKALASAGKFEQALAEIENLEGIDGSRALLGQLARIYVRVGREREAAAALERYLEIRPSSQSLVMLAQIRVAQNEIEEAERLLDAAEGLDPRDGVIYIARGDIALSAGNMQSAREHYTKAGEVDPYRSTVVMRSRLAMLRSRATR